METRRRRSPARGEVDPSAREKRITRALEDVLAGGGRVRTCANEGGVRTYAVREHAGPSVLSASLPRDVDGGEVFGAVHRHAAGPTVRAIS